MKNKRRAVLKLNKPGAAAAMCKFFKVYPYSLRDSVLSFSLSPKLAALEGQDDKKVPVKESTDKNSTVESASNTDKVAPSSNTTEDSTKTLATTSSQPKATAALHSSCTSKDAGKPKAVGKPKEVKGSAIVSKKPSVPPSKLSPAAATTVKSSSASLSPIKPNLSPSFATKEKTASVPATKPAPALVSPAKPKSEPITFSFVVPEEKLKAAIESSTLSSEEGKPTSSSVSSGHSKAAAVSSTPCTEKPKLVADTATSEEQMDENGKESQNKTVAVPSAVDDLHLAAADSEIAAGAVSKIALSQTDAPCAKGPFQKSETVPAKSDSKSKLATKQDTRKESDTGKHLSTDTKQLSHTSSTRHSLDCNKDRVSHSATRSGSRRGHSPYEKDRRLEHKDISRYCRERERSSGGKRDDDRSKHSSGRSTRTSKSINSSKLHRAQQKVEEITFSFNLDDYVTVDEIGDETEEPSVRVSVVDDPEKSSSVSVGEESLVQPGVKKEGSVSKDSTDDKSEVKASGEMLPSVDSSSAKEPLYPAAHSDKDADISSVLPCCSGIPKCTLHPFGSEEKKDISEGLCTSSSASEENALKSESLTQKRSDLPEDLSSIPSCMAVHASIKHDSFQMQADELGNASSGGVPLSLPHEKSLDASDSKPASANDPVLPALQSNAQKIGVSKAGQPSIPAVKKESLLQHETPKGKKVVHTKDINSDSRSKKKKSTDAAVDDFSFVTLDEIGEEDSSLSNETAVVGPHNEESTLVTVDEVGPDDLTEIEKELHIQVEGDSSSVVRLPVSADVEKSEKMVEDFKAGIKDMPSGTGNTSACNVTLPFSESQGDKKEQPVGTLDENTEDDDDACTFFSTLKGDMNFVTVDEIGGDDEDQIAELEASAVEEDQIKEDSSNVKEMTATTSTGARGTKRKQSPGEVQTRSKKAAIEEEGAQQTNEAESQGSLQAAAESVPQLTDKEKK
ncbi:zinc finger protein 638-like isoform X2 [Protopterus annectens]|nr:zinc finger protein 638-like isoform X2 [Protopterus annectens]